MTTHIMTLLLAESARAALRGDVPVAAAVVDPRSGEIVALASNRVEEDHDPTAHAEVLAIRAACAQQNSPRLPAFDLYVTLEPCAMCAAAISMARLRKVVFGAYDPKGGAVEHGPRFFAQPTCHHAPEVIGGVCETECATQLKQFFEAKRV